MIWAGVAVAAFVSLGAFLTFMSGDAARLFQSVSAVFFDRPPPVSAPASRHIQAEAVTGCKYCLTLKTIQKSFEAKAKAAHDLQDAALNASRTGSPNKAPGAKGGASRAELAAATDSFERYAAAAQALLPFVQACEQESFCQPDFTQASAGGACRETVEDAGLRSPVMGMANVAREAALACIAQACPSVDCAAAGNLRQDLIEASQAMEILGGPVALSKTQPRLTDLPVGAATLSVEVAKAIQEVEYLAKLYPSLIERPDAPKLERASDMPAMVADLAQRQSESMRSAADVMTQASVVTPFTQDARREAAWRMKSLSLSVAEAGRMSAPELLNGPEGKAYRIALSQNWGAALVDLAAASALMDRLARDKAAPAGCNGQTASAAQAARDAAALLDICRARAACPVGLAPRGAGPLKTLEDARRSLSETIPRGQSAGDLLSAALGPAPDAGTGAPELAHAAVVLNAGGVCQAGQPQQ